MSRMYQWPVQLLCGRQLLDIRREDILHHGFFRRCDTARAGDGHDLVAKLAEKRLGIPNANEQFVVQLGGCPLNCWYCYVTRDGIDGDPIGFDVSELIHHYREAQRIFPKIKVFHLMGGAPALYFDHWPELTKWIKYCFNDVFHSDMLLIEGAYDVKLFPDIFQKNTLFAINIKGTSDEELHNNTGVVWTPGMVELFWENLDKIVVSGYDANCYFTFTNCDPDGVQDFLKKIEKRYAPIPSIKNTLLTDYLEIPIKHYKAIEWN